MRIIGAADEFWRLRLTKVDTTDELDFEWHPDILYREPIVKDAEERELWHVEAIRIEDYDTIIRLATFTDRDSAAAFMARAEEDLRDLTKNQFEDAYLTPGTAAASPDDPAEPLL